MPIVDIFSLFFIALGIYFLVRFLIWLSGNILSYGIIGRYLENKKISWLSKPVEKLLNENDQEAWDKTWPILVAKLSKHKHFDTRIATIEYLNADLDNGYSPSRPLLSALIKKIPDQSRRPDVETKLIGLICKILYMIESKRTHNNATIQDANKNSRVYSQETLDNFQRSITIWLSELIYLFYIWFKVESFSFAFLLINSVLLILLTSYSLALISSGIEKIVNGVLLATAVIMGFTWLYSSHIHQGILTTENIKLDKYGLDVNLQIDYPGWLTVDDIDRCDKAIVVSFSKEIDKSIEFLYDHDILYIKDMDCNWQEPFFEIDRKIAFYILPKDKNSLINNKTSTSTKTIITPGIMSEKNGGELLPIEELELTISLEDPIWKNFRDICSALTKGTSALTALLYAVLKYIESANK